MSSGTESANLALVGTALANKDARRNTVLMGAAEHHCVLNTKPLLERLGYRVSLVPVTREGLVEPDRLLEKISEDVLLVSVMHVNNELGTVNPIPNLARIAQDYGCLFHTDAVQSFPFVPSVDELGVDLLSVSSHKLYGPSGAAALFVRAGTRMEPLAVGGGQEREVRAGTENVAGIVGFAAAVEWCLANQALDQTRRAARDEFRAILSEENFVPTVRESCVSSGHFHCRCPGIDAETMLIRLDIDGVEASSGAACSSGSLEPSHVLAACGYTDQEAKEGLRFSFGLQADIRTAQEAARRVIAARGQILHARRRD